MSISFLLAMDSNRGIGLNNSLPWRLPADMAYVKRLTMGQTLLMGRKTYDSIGKPLPGRRNVVMTQQPDYRPEGCEVVHSVAEALDKYQDAELFVFGGAEIYKLFMPYVDKMYITEVGGVFEVDTWFPKMDMLEWAEVSRTHGAVDEKNKYPHDFVVYERKIKE
ncbi:dihydrofolate reductase [Paenibacillus thalictri]|uniref:Dihydrofolate reductase n=1 Tax=Paenibacillus thalictri TaxID=2527873 RepID=A0A4Q9DJB9_9BACL|nr:dihydrofolate reductase [Paenibacillus thalictri]TBL71036.1 dihydrofolate reductase [Paenibacillus thalictri]